MIRATSIRRFIYNTFAAISAAVLVVSLGLWAASYFYETRVSITWNNNDYLIGSLRGRALLRIDWNVGVGSTIRVEHLPQSLSSFNQPSYDRNAGMHFAGFGYGRVSGWRFVGGAFGWWSKDNYVVPYWFIALLTLAPVLHRIVIRRRNVPAGHCRACGYNLVGTTGRQCPECGEAIAHQFRKARASTVAREGGD